MLVDTHCHLDFPDFAEDLDSVVANAHDAGIGTMVTIGTHLSKAQQVIDIAERFDNIYCTVGIHPHNAAEETEITADDLLAYLDNPKVVGFGETGLDYFYDHSPREIQQKQFRTHIAACRNAQVPVIVHTRDAEADTLTILEEEYAKGAFPGLIHCYSASQAFADRILPLGLYVSFSGIVTFKTAQELRDVAVTIPADRLLVETDSPYLAPIPKRGKRNEPAFTAHTAAVLAEVRGESFEGIVEQTTQNFHRLFTRARPS